MTTPAFTVTAAEARKLSLEHIAICEAKYKQIIFNTIHDNSVKGRTRCYFDLDTIKCDCHAKHETWMAFLTDLGYTWKEDDHMSAIEISW